MVASRRVWALAGMAFLVAAVLVVGGSVAAIPLAQPPAHPASGSDQPSCALSANCAGGGALSGGSVFVAASDCGPRSGLERVPTFSRLVVAASGHLPSGVPTRLFRPPQGSWI